MIIFWKQESFLIGNNNKQQRPSPPQNNKKLELVEREWEGPMELQKRCGVSLGTVYVTEEWEVNGIWAKNIVSQILVSSPACRDKWTNIWTSCKFLGIEQRPWLWEQRLSIWDPDPSWRCYVQAHAAPCAEHWGQTAGTFHWNPLF